MQTALRTARLQWSAMVAAALVALCSVGAAAQHAARGPRPEVDACAREVLSLDNGWLFHRGDSPGSQDPTAPVDAWRPVTLPHDWSIAGPFLPSNPSGGAGAFAPMGVGWYRRHLPTPPASCLQRTYVQFDGIMANSDVWINGHLLGHRPNGYVTLRYDLTPFLAAKPGADNVIAVRADNSLQPSSRFYQGAGIYRHVHLLRVPELHFQAWATFVTTPHVAADSAVVRVQTALHNDGEQSAIARFVVALIDASGRVVARATSAPSSVGAQSTAPFAATLHVTHPHLWNLDDPAMYRARVQVVVGKRNGDRESVPFGIRDAHFEAATGFWLNGKNIKIKGVALHSDIGAMGMAAPLSLWELRLRSMKRMGANAIRTAHNPVAPEFLDLCDRMGFLVLDEFFDAWTVGKTRYDYHLYFRKWYLTDTHDTVLRDRNHPSVIAWSAGNEIHDTPHPEIAKPILASLIAEYHKDDPTRPVTQALFRPNASHDYQDGLADMLDVVGQNYRPGELLAAHDAKPIRKILGTENGHSRETWLAVRDHAAYSGMFLWSGTDYLGESRHWPLIANPSGMNDRTDFPKPDSLQRESWWADHPAVYVVRRIAPVPPAPTDPGYEVNQYRPGKTAFHDWTPEDLGPHTEHVEAYSNCQTVDLALNGKDLGEKSLPADAAPRTWDVDFAPGTIIGRCLDHPEVSDALRTAGPAAVLRLTADTTDLGTGFDHVAQLRVTVIDVHGNPVPGARVLVTFAVTGPARLLATDNADDAYTAPFSNPERMTYDGRAVALLRGTAPGTAVLRASSPGLVSARIQLRVAEDRHPPEAAREQKTR